MNPSLTMYSFDFPLRGMHLTDMHLCPLSKAPQSRTEFFVDQIVGKFAEVKRIIKEENIQFVVVSGDLFHIKAAWNYIPEYVTFWQDQMESWGIPVFMIPGNHDLQKSSMDNFQRSAYYSFIRGCRNAHDLYSGGDVGVRTQNSMIRITGVPYYPLERVKTELDTLNGRLNPAEYNMVLAHLDVIPQAGIPLFWETMTYQELRARLSQADLICLGHIHQSFPLSVESPTTSVPRRQIISKPWSFTRTVKDYFVSSEILEHLHKPSYTLIELDEGSNGGISASAEYKVIPHAPFELAFSKEDLGKQIENSLKVQSFMRQVRDQFSSVENAFSVEDPEVYLARQNIPQDVRDLIQEYLEKDR